MDETGWKGTRVLHADGRVGKVIETYSGFLHVGLHLSVDDGGRAYIQLNTQGADSGDAGWQWFCEHFDGGPAWLPLGDHSGCEIEFDVTRTPKL